MAHSDATARQAGLLGDVLDRANPAFAAAAVVVPLAALTYALTLGSLRALFYVHVMAGGLWTGVDVFMGFVVGPVLGGLEPEERTAVFERLVPKMTFLMPTLAATTITGGIYLARRMGVFDLSDPWILAALVVATLLTIQGFGVILPNEIRVFRQLLSESPDTEFVSKIGMRNARLGGVQGVLQLAIIFVMANLRL